MLIEKATVVDLPKILQLQKTCYQESAERYDDFGIPPLVQTIEQLEAEHTTSTILKALERDEIVGSIRAFARDGTCYIGRVIVHPKFQNRGIGKRMMQAIEDTFLSEKRFELFTGFRDEKNLYFYKSQGYVPFKEERRNEKIAFVFLEKKRR